MAQTIRPDELKALLSGNMPPTVLDVRPRADHEANPEKTKGATWRDPGLDAYRETISGLFRFLPPLRVSAVWTPLVSEVSP
ncbi:MAG: hypothetical protein V1793_22065 [Pseudomonadota bacterium]